MAAELFLYSQVIAKCLGANGVFHDQNHAKWRKVVSIPPLNSSVIVSANLSVILPGNPGLCPGT
jgi:hypothetical protein